MKKHSNIHKKLITKRCILIIISIIIIISVIPHSIREKISKERNVSAEVKLKNPRVVKDNSMRAKQKVTWDCIYFGSYPQTEIVDKAETSGVYEKIWKEKGDYEIDTTTYAKLKEATGWNNDGDIVIDGIKYRRINEDDAVFVSGRDQFYDWNKDKRGTYHYFRYDKIKWRILNNSKNDLLLISDKALDNRRYNEDIRNITWEKSTIRSWLNGYSASENSIGKDYSKENFIESAFSKTERDVINNTKVVNKDNIDYKVSGGNDTKDKIFLLSETDTYTNTAKKYGLISDRGVYDEGKFCKTSTYAKAMGTFNSIAKGYIGGCWWWLRSPGQYEDCAAGIFEYGYGYNSGYLVDDYDNGVRPVIKLNIADTDLWSYAGTVCSDGTVNENSNNNTSTKGFCQNNEYVKQLNPEQLLQNINIDGGKLNSPQIKILGNQVTLLNMKSNVKLPLNDSVQAIYDPKENKVEVLIGFKEISEDAAISADGNTTAYWSQSYKQVKNLYQKVSGKKVTTTKLWNDYSKLRGKLKKQNEAGLGLNVKASIAGYMEFSCGNGNVEFSEGGIITEFGTGADYDFHWTPPFTAVYTRVEIGVDANGKIGLKYTKAKQAALIGNLDVDGKLTGAIGIGTHKGGTYAEGQLTGSLKNTLKFPVQTAEKSLSIIGNLKAKINVAVLNYDLTENNLEHSFGNYQFFPRTTTAKTKIKKFNLNIKASDLGLVKRTGLDNATDNLVSYSQNRSFEKNNCFSNASPQLISLTGGKKLLVWNDDDPRKTDENNIAIFYSVYDGNKWSEEKILDDEGCLCSTVSYIKNNGKVEILFSRSNEKIKQGSTLDDTLTKMDLYTAEFDGTKFTTSKKISTEQNSLYEMMYGSGMDKNKVYYSWVENSNNSYFLSEGINKIYMMEDGEKTLVQKTDNVVSDVVIDSKRKRIVWKEISKDDEQVKLYSYDGKIKEELPIAENCSNLKIEDEELFYMTETGIGHIDLNTGYESEIIPVNLDDYEIKKLGEDCYIVYRQTTEDGGQELWMMHGRNDEWSDSIQITDNKFFVKSMSININEEGLIMAARNLAEITKDGVQFDKGNLVVDTLDDYADLVCGNSLIYDENSIKPSEKMTFTYTVYNNSQRDINSYQVELKDGNGNTLLEDTIDHEIKAGEKKEEILEYTLPNELKKTDVALTIKAPYKEKNINNNSCSTTYGYADAEITDMESQNGKVRITFCNNGYEDIDDFKIRLYMDSKETEALCTYTGEKLKVGEAKTMECVIPKDKLTKSGGKGSLIAEISISNEEDIVGNNTKYIDYFWEKEGVVKDNTEHQKDVEKDNTKYTEHFGEKKTLISKISITGISKNIARGKKILLKANIYPTEASNKNVTWKSSNRKFATVNKNGVVTIKKKAAGKTVTITAIANDGSGKTATYKIAAMKGIVKKITIPGKKSVKAGKTLKLKAKVKATKGANKKLIWKSSNTKYATVSKDGKVKTMKTGKGRKVKITAMATDGSGKKKTVTIKIK